MKAAVLGVGRMGTAICHAMHKLGFKVVGADSNEHAAENFRKFISGPDGAFYLTDENDADKMMETALLFEKPDIVISSLPYHQTEMMGYWCIDNGFRYCDLGGRVDVSKNINDYAKKRASKPVFTDLGLAPGWVNILAEYGCSQIHRTPEKVSMMVGGLPAIKVNPPLNYATTWSVDGLINEYRDDCEVLVDGEIKTVKGMDGKQKVSFELFEGEELEAFFTSGGASHTIHSMKSRGVKNCSYKTIRYKGHCDAIKFLFNTAELSEECLDNIFKTGCQDVTGDIVLIKSEVIAGDVTWKKEIVVGYDAEVSKTRFSAMQKATAYAISSVAEIMAEGYFDDRKIQNRGGDIKLPVVLEYRDVPYERFNKNLDKLGIKI